MIKIHKKICLPLPPRFLVTPPRLAFPPGYFGQFANPPGWGLLKLDYPPGQPGGVDTMFTAFIQSRISSSWDSITDVNLSAFRNEKKEAQFSIFELRLDSLMRVEFTHGSTCMHWYPDHLHLQMTSGEFLTKALISSITSSTTLPFPRRSTARGLSAEKKKDIVSKLVPLMRAPARPFWENLAVSKNGDEDLEINI